MKEEAGVELRCTISMCSCVYLSVDIMLNQIPYTNNCKVKEEAGVELHNFNVFFCIHLSVDIMINQIPYTTNCKAKEEVGVELRCTISTLTIIALSICCSCHG